MKMSFIRVLIVCALGAIASTTQAGLIHVNDDTFDSRVSQPFEVTRDSDTGLDWLDVDAYVNVSWNEVDGLLGTVGHILEDWRHATRDEVGVYFGNLGLSIGNYPFSTTVVFDSGVSGNAAEAYTGNTATGVGAEDNYAEGLTSTPIVVNDLTNYYRSKFIFDSRSHTKGHNYVRDNGVGPYLGHWLVRTHVIPEPSTFSMLAFCGIAMAGYSRLRRRRK
jgi:hypothetical protein